MPKREEIDAKYERLKEITKTERRLPFKPTPIDSDVTEEDGILVKRGIEDEELGRLFEKGDKLTRVLKNTEDTLKLIRKIYMRKEVKKNVE